MKSGQAQDYFYEYTIEQSDGMLSDHFCGIAQINSQKQLDVSAQIT